jgi:hypothetical protein
MSLVQDALEEKYVGKSFALSDGSVYKVTRVHNEKVYGVCENWKEGYANEACRLIEEAFLI